MNDTHKDKLQKPYKSFSKCPVLMLSYLLMHESNMSKLSVIAIDANTIDSNTVDCSEGSYTPIEDINMETSLDKLNIEKFCIDATNKDAIKIMGIPDEGMKAKYGPSRAEVIIYREEPIELALEIPAKLFIEVFMNLKEYIDSCGELKINQEYVFEKIWKDVDKRYETDTGIRKKFYGYDTQVLINDYIQSISLGDDNSCSRCVYLANLYKAVEAMHDSRIEDSVHYPNYEKKVEKLRRDVSADWCRNSKCQRYYI